MSNEISCGGTIGLVGDWTPEMISDLNLISKRFFVSYGTGGYPINEFESATDEHDFKYTAKNWFRGSIESFHFGFADKDENVDLTGPAYERLCEKLKDPDKAYINVDFWELHELFSEPDDDYLQWEIDGNAIIYAKESNGSDSELQLWCEVQNIDDYERQFENMNDEMDDERKRIDEQMEECPECDQYRYECDCGYDWESGQTGSNPQNSDDLKNTELNVDRHVKGENMGTNEKILKFAVKTAETADAEYQYQLADCYLEFEDEGNYSPRSSYRVAPEDFLRARHWLIKAAERGNADAQLRLSELYQLGWRFEFTDSDKARFWAEKAVEQGHTKAKSFLAYILSMSDGSDEDDDTAQYKLYAEAAEEGDAEAQKNLADYYSTYMIDQGIEKDDEKAVFWYSKAAEQGEWEATYWLAWHYFEAKGVDRDLEKALHWAIKSDEDYSTSATKDLVNNIKAVLNDGKEWCIECNCLTDSDDCKCEE